MATPQEEVVMIVGGGPSGIAMLPFGINQLSIPNLILEKEDCYASIWNKYSYDRLHLHLPKQYCYLPHIPFPTSYPTYVSRNDFTRYLDHYVSHFNINQRILYRRSVESAFFDKLTSKWIVKVRNNNVEEECYCCKFLVVATGEFSDAFIPGLETFTGEAILHSTQYKNGNKFKNKSILVVGSGNSGMEIALDLANCGANNSIVIRSPMNIMTKEMSYLGTVIMKYFLSKLVYGDISKYLGVIRPTEGPYANKIKYRKYPLVDVGTYQNGEMGSTV